MKKSLTQKTTCTANQLQRNEKTVRVPLTVLHNMTHRLEIKILVMVDHAVALHCNKGLQTIVPDVLVSAQKIAVKLSKQFTLNFSI